jgi:hypothetical protein
MNTHFAPLGVAPHKKVVFSVKCCAIFTASAYPRHRQVALKLSFEEDLCWVGLLDEPIFGAKLALQTFPKAVDVTFLVQ